MCDAATLRVQRVFWHRFTPWFRPSWCYECGWRGMLRTGDLTPVDTGAAQPRSKVKHPS